MLTEYKILISKIVAVFITAFQVSIIVGVSGSEVISLYLILALFFICQLSAFLIFKDDCMTKRYRERLKREKSQEAYIKSRRISLYLRIASIIEAICGPIFLVVWVLIG